MHPSSQDECIGLSSGLHYICITPCFVLVEHPVCHEPISVLITATHP